MRLIPVRKAGRAGGYLPYVLTVAAIWLAWQIVLQPIIARGPVEAAVRVAASSPTVLRRAAESELQAGSDDIAAKRTEAGDRRFENAGFLARDALRRAPFDVKALRTVGLSDAHAGREDRADEILTLAGNWSLRDDPSHAWLIQRRLRRGDLGSAFAHADTLVRRREDIRPQIFNLFTQAAIHAPQAGLPHLAALLTRKPPWRTEYLGRLYTTADGMRTATNLAVLMQKGSAPFTDDELSQFYMNMLDKGQLPAIRAVRDEIRRPALSPVVNGGFESEGGIAPFMWTLGEGVGVTSEIVPDDVDPKSHALRIDYDGYTSARAAEQLVLLAPGRHVLSGRLRLETGTPSRRLLWNVVCTGGDLKILSTPVSPSTDGRWGRFSLDFVVPDACAGQLLRLEAQATGDRDHLSVWFDDIAIDAPAAAQREAR